MEYRIRYYVEDLFRNAPQTEKTMDTREEIISNLLEKFRELVGQGMDENKAYAAAIETIGNINEIFENLGYEVPKKKKEVKKNTLSPSNAAILRSITGLIWLFCVAFYIFISFKTSAWHITWVVFVITPAITSFVAALFHWKSGGRFKGLIDSAMWCLITAIYFLISFDTGDWHLTWIIFLIGAAISEIINIVFNLSSKNIKEGENSDENA